MVLDITYIHIRSGLVGTTCKLPISQGNYPPRVYIMATRKAPVPWLPGYVDSSVRVYTVALLPCEHSNTTYGGHQSAYMVGTVDNPHMPSKYRGIPCVYTIELSNG